MQKLPAPDFPVRQASPALGVSGTNAGTSGQIFTQGVLRSSTRSLAALVASTLISLPISS